MSRQVSIAALVIAAVLPSVLRAQDNNLNVFLHERNYAGVRSPTVLGAPDYYAAVAEPDLIAEAQFVAHVPLMRGLNAQEIREGLGGWGFNLFLTPWIRLRALDVDSSPVRSISFMPKFTAQVLKSIGGSLGVNSGMRYVVGANMVLGHHSNGGSGCEFEDEDASADCARVGPTVPASERAVRVVNGDFSTNYVQIGGGSRIGSVTDNPTWRWTWAVDIAGAIQHHHDWFPFPLPGGADGDFASLFGQTRYQLDVAGHRLLGSRVALRGRVQASGFATDADRFPEARNYALESEAFVQGVPSGGGNQPWYGFLGLGFRYSRGQDHYNTQFVRDISHFQVVLFVDPWSPMIN